MYIKIYFGDKPVFLCDDIDAEIHEYLHHPDTVFIDEISNPAIKSMLHEIIRNEFHSGIVFYPDLKKLEKAFFKHFTIVEAAGGLVENEKGEYLFIFRRGKWDLPKGKLDKGESPEDCAVREVLEETGIKLVKLGEKIAVTYHTYKDFGKLMLKESHWYFMMASSKEKLEGQAEEDIEEICWVRPSAIGKYLLNSFPSVQDVFGIKMVKEK